MMSDGKLAAMILSAVWNEDVRGLRRVLCTGTDPNWIFNGYPILIHAVFARNEKTMMLLIKTGAVQVEEALGSAPNRCMEEMIFPLAFLGIMPKEEEVKEGFGPYPSWYCLLDYLLPARTQTGGIMKRCAACIRILQLLRPRGFMTREEPAQELDTNVRNILEYRKELEETGYVIEGTTGKYNGYQLKSGTLLPVAGLYEEGLCLLQESRRYLGSRRDFLSYATYCRATDKSLATTTLQVWESGVYVEESADVAGAMISMIRICEQGRNALSTVELQYESLHASDFETIVIQPYEVINVRGSYYCLAYSLKVRVYRNSKLSEERIWNVRLTRRPSVRDADLHIRDYIGKTGLIRDEIVELKLYVHGESARLVSKKKSDISPVLEWVDEQTLHLITMMEGRISVRSFLLSPGNQCQLVNPQDLRQEIYVIVKDMLVLYS